jgi:hypothetical protein
VFDSDELRRQRDRGFARALTGHTIYLAMVLRDWILEEATEARPLLQSLEMALTGVVTGRLRQAQDFVERIERGEAKAAFDEVQAWCDEVREDVEVGSYSDPLEAMLDGNRALWRLESQIRELFRIRTFVDRFMSESESNERGSEGNEPPM